ncbi:MAG: hypothetical protein HRF52_03060 [Ignavibacterium sp.]|jgi:hypothetical protein|uniref:hypothetical protein n=1 Tax=Ignavibacterium sp. TaxID=2651167 RepID=UPI003298B8F5
MKFFELFFIEKFKESERIIFPILSLLPVIIALLFMPEFMGDDTYIHIGFIKGLLETGKFSFTGTETYGSTSPLWVIINSLFSLITGNPESSITILSGLFTILTILLLNYLLKLFDLNVNLRFLLILSLALNPFFIKWSISGMEASATMSFLIICMIYLFKSKDDSINYYGTFLGLSFLLRPEFFVVFVFSLLFLLKVKKNFLFVISFATQFLIVIISWLVYAYVHFGTIIPNTFRAKAKDSFFHIEPEKLLRNIKVLVAGNFPEFIILVIIILSLILIKFRKEDSAKNISRNYFNIILKPELISILLWIIGFYLFYIIKNVTILSRYSLMFVPAIILLMGILLNNLNTILNEKIYRFVLVSYLTIILAINNFILFNTVIPSSNNFARGFQNTFKKISEIIKEDTSVANKSVALTDVGIVGTFSSAKVYDLAGLVDSDRFNYPNYAEYVFAKKPDYLILREEAEISEVIPKNVNYKILYQKKVPGFGINSPEPRTVTLYKIFW